MPMRCNPPRNQRDFDKEMLIRRMERVLERPLSPVEIRLILLAETIREEMDDHQRAA